jgi:hypothetical protein
VANDPPTRQQAEAEYQLERQIETYEDRFRAWCRGRGLDPDSLDAVLAFEGWWAEMGEDWG